MEDHDSDSDSLGLPRRRIRQVEDQLNLFEYSLQMLRNSIRNASQRQEFERNLDDMLARLNITRCSDAS